MSTEEKSRGDHADCGLTLVWEMATLGCEITVGTSPPIVMDPYVEAMKCPHGTTFYYEPTSDQIAAWAEAGVR